jgi:hypothetical protein
MSLSWARMPYDDTRAATIARHWNVDGADAR